MPKMLLSLSKSSKFSALAVNLSKQALPISLVCCIFELSLEDFLHSLQICQSKLCPFRSFVASLQLYYYEKRSFASIVMLQS